MSWLCLLPLPDWCYPVLAMSPPSSWLVLTLSCLCLLPLPDWLSPCHGCVSSRFLFGSYPVLALSLQRFLIGSYPALAVSPPASWLALTLSWLCLLPLPDWLLPCPGCVSSRFQISSYHVLAVSPPTSWLVLPCPSYVSSLFLIGSYPVLAVSPPASWLVLTLSWLCLFGVFWLVLTLSWLCLLPLPDWLSSESTPGRGTCATQLTEYTFWSWSATFELP